MTYDRLLELLDLEAVVAAGLSTGLKQTECDAFDELILKALKKWVVPDYDDLDIESVEQRFAIEVSWLTGRQQLICHTNIESSDCVALGSQIFKGFTDLVGIERGTGLRRAIDWKVVGTLDRAKQELQRGSWQWKLYATAVSADKFHYRSLQRDARTAELVLNWPQPDVGVPEVRNYIQHVLALRDSQYELQGPWVQHAPYACMAYNDECPYKQHCWEGHVPPGEPPLKALSHSDAERLLLCPERYRLDLVLDAPDTDASKARTSLGVAFHAAISTIYKQVQQLQQNGVV